MKKKEIMIIKLLKKNLRFKMRIIIIYLKNMKNCKKIIGILYQKKKIWKNKMKNLKI